LVGRSKCTTNTEKGSSYRSNALQDVPNQHPDGTENDNQKVPSDCVPVAALKSVAFTYSTYTGLVYTDGRDESRKTTSVPDTFE